MPDVGITTDLLTLGHSILSVLVIGIKLFLSNVTVCQFLSVVADTVTHSESLYLNNHHGSDFPAFQWSWEDTNSFSLHLPQVLTTSSNYFRAQILHRETRASRHLPCTHTFCTPHVASRMLLSLPSPFLGCSGEQAIPGPLLWFVTFQVIIWQRCQ